MSDTPRERVAKAYAAEDADKHDKFRAQAYKPEGDAEADRLAKLDNLPPNLRMGIGYHQSARAAAERLEDKVK